MRWDLGIQRLVVQDGVCWGERLVVKLVQVLDGPLEPGPCAEEPVGEREHQDEPNCNRSICKTKPDKVNFTEERTVRARLRLEQQEGLSQTSQSQYHGTEERALNCDLKTTRAEPSCHRRVCKDNFLMASNVWIMSHGTVSMKHGLNMRLGALKLAGHRAVSFEIDLNTGLRVSTVT